jgi:hypothetical protein
VDLLLLREKASELVDDDVPQPSTPAAPAADPSEPTDRRWSAS